jgi:hypothetical protein
MATRRSRYSSATAQNRDELGAVLVAAGLGPAPEHALLCLLALNGLRVSEATGAGIAHLGLERGPPGSSIVTGSSVNAMICPAPARPRRKTPSDAGHICSAGRSRDPSKGPRRNW